MRVSTEEWRVSGSMVSRASPPRRTREVVPHERLVTGSRSSLWGDWTPEAPESARRVSLLGLRRRERDAWAPAWGDGGPEWDPEKDKKKKKVWLVGMHFLFGLPVLTPDLCSAWLSHSRVSLGLC